MKASPSRRRAAAAYLLAYAAAERAWPEETRRGYGRGWGQERSYVKKEAGCAVRKGNGRGSSAAASEGPGDDIHM